MEFTKPSVLSQQPSTQFHQSSTHCFSSTQQAGYMGPQPGCIDLFGQHNNLYPSSGILTASPFPDKREMILREIEKEQIRAQQIMMEIAKMHVLEGEINKELSQVEAAKLTVSELKSVTQNQKPGNLNNDQERTTQSIQNNGEPKKNTCNIWCEICKVGTSTGTFMNNHEKGKKHLRRLKKIVKKGETGEGNQKANIEVLLNSVEHVSESGRSLLSRNFDVVMDEAMSELRKPVDVSGSGFETSPVQIRSEDRRVSGVTPLTKNGNEEEKSIFVGNHDATIFGSKLKAVTLPIADASECPSNIILRKKSDREQSCGDSQVNVTSESALKEHLREKKHRFSEVSLKPRSPGKNCRINTILEKTVLPYNPKPEKDQEKTLQSVQRSPDPKNTKHKFWCEMCQVGAPSERVMNNHEKGKKHVKHLKNRAQNGEIGPSYKNEKMEVSAVQHFSEGGKNIISETVDAYEKGSHEFVLESKAKGEEERDLEVTGQDEIGQGLDMIDPEVDLIIDAVLPEDEDIVAKGKWSCDLCQVFAVTVSALNEFLLGRNKKMKVASLKTPLPERDPGQENIAADTTLPKETESTENSKPYQLKTFPSQKNDGDKHISECGKGILSNNAGEISTKSRLKLASLLDTADNGSETSLIQFQIVDLQVSNVKPVQENDHKEECVLVVNLDADSSKRQSDIILYKNSEGEQSCDESALTEQLCGKKHKLEEASLQSQSPGKNSNVGRISHDTLLMKNTGLLENPKSDNFKNDPSVQKKGDLKKIKDNFWLEKRRIWTFSGNVIDEEKCGKDENHLKDILQNSETKMCDQKENIEVSVDYDANKGERSIISDNVDVVSREARLELHKCLDASDNGFETLSIQIEAVDIRRPEVKPIMRNDIKEEIVFVANPDANISGSKCKTATPTALKDMCEKKHKLKENLLKPQSPGKHCGIGQFPRDTLLSTETELLVNLKSDNYKKGHVKTIQSVQKNGDPKMTKDVFWREMNQVRDEERGRKRNEIVRNDETGPWDHKEKIDEHVNHVKHISEVGKFIFPHILAKQDAKATGVDITKSGHGSTLHAFSPKDGEINVQGKWNCALCQVIAPNESSLNEHLCGKKHKLKEASLKTVHASSPKDGEINAQGEWNCALCQVIAPNESSLNEHLCGKKHKLKEASLITRHASSPIDGEINAQGEWNRALCQVIAPNESSLNEHLCGKKHKLKEASLKTVHASSPKDGDINAQGEWNCALCQVIATNESSLNEHLCGKKHKLKEASLKTVLASSPKDGEINAQGEWNCALCQVIATNESSLNEHLCGKKHKLKEASLKTVHASSPKDGEINAQGERNCALCQVIAPNESSLNEHLCGKKHKLKEASLKAVHASSPKDGATNAQGEWNCAICQIIAPNESSLNEHLCGKKHKLKEASLKTVHASSPKDGEINAQGKWNCALCQVIATNESSLNEHLCGKKHKLKEASLKTQKPGNDSSMSNVAIVTLQEHLKSDNTKKDNAEKHRSVGKNDDLKKTINFGRQVGPSEKVTYILEKAKESAEIDERKPSNLKEKMEVSVDCVEHVSKREQSIFSEMFGQVIATNESPLNDHKLKEASLKTQRPGNNFSVENTLLEYPKSDNMKEDSTKSIRSAGKNGDFKKTTGTKHSNWRRSCQVGPLEEVTYNLEKGKESAENDKRGPYNEKEKMEVPVNCVARVSESEKMEWSMIKQD